MPILCPVGMVHYGDETALRDRGKNFSNEMPRSALNKRLFSEFHLMASRQRFYICVPYVLKTYNFPHGPGDWLSRLLRCLSRSQTSPALLSLLPAGERRSGGCAPPQDLLTHPTSPQYSRGFVTKPLRRHARRARGAAKEGGILETVC